ncbi:SDR family NAD(P)-dependent oxidoreductase [Ruegeria sp. R13_0]|uniref:SDR family NAD(P)-dependent oxidoreductase n=1 Tax=Ruegeria sp. R13_0 TaxID=2821099 RepID=UPI001FFDF9AF|nr:SDR family NAD(P)-dependent oxidoreductase [Ruegeria sp. R13_0]
MGQAICRQLRADGFHVFGLDLNEEGLGEMATELGSDFTPICVDLTDPIAIAHTLNGIRSEYCGLNALVNNAGTQSAQSFAGEITKLTIVELRRCRRHAAQNANRFHRLSSPVA